MRRLLLLTALVLVLPVMAAGEEPPLDIEALFAPATSVSEAPDLNGAGVEAAPAIGDTENPLELGLVPTECSHPEPNEGFCDRWDSSYCDYEWDCQCCCVAVYAAPGANCANICI